MSLKDLKHLYIFSCIMLGLIILSPTLAMVLKLPGGDKFSELWVLGPGLMVKDYPFIVSANKVYKICLGVANHMGDLEYYLVYLKFGNQTEALPNLLNGNPSGLEPSFEYNIFLSENQNRAMDINFSFPEISFEGNVCKIIDIMIDNREFSAKKSISWDEEYNGYFFQIFFELWRYNVTAENFQYDNRFVCLWLNITKT